MKRLVIVLACTAGAFAAQAQTFIDNARVRGVEPQYENISVPREECRAEWVTEPVQAGGGRTNYNGAVLGALAGGVLGNQLGRGGHGREAATMVGVVVGALAGDRIADNRRYGYEPVQQVSHQVQRCQTVNEVQSRITGYRVAYDYQGQTYSTVMRDNPGPSLQVRVSVDPVTRY